MKIGSKLQYEVPDKCPEKCEYKNESFYQGCPCHSCPLFNCNAIDDDSEYAINGKFRLVEPEDYRDDWAEEWVKYFKEIVNHA